jgi:cell division protein FtsZ
LADIRAVMEDAGPALIGIGQGIGEDRAVEAAREAISNPLLEASMEGARGILFHVSGPTDLRLQEIRDAADAIRATADPRANIIFGASFNGLPDGEVRITLIATGLEARRPIEPVAEATPRRSARRRSEPTVTPADDNLEIPTFLRRPGPPSPEVG